MAKKPFTRKHRYGKLSSAQAARDEDVRRKVEAEFPPLEGASPGPILSDPLRNAIAQSQKSVRQLAKEARISAVVLTQFLDGARDLRLATAEKLAHVLGLKLVAN